MLDLLNFKDAKIDHFRKIMKKNKCLEIYYKISKNTVCSSISENKMLNKQQNIKLEKKKYIIN